MPKPKEEQPPSEAAPPLDWVGPDLRRKTATTVSDAPRDERSQAEAPLRTPARLAPRSTMALGILLLVLLPGCAKGALELLPRRPTGPALDTVAAKLCRGDEVGALRYLEDRGLSAPDREDVLERARKRNAQDPACCPAKSLCEPVRVVEPVVVPPDVR